MTVVVIALAFSYDPLVKRISFS